MEKPDLLNLLKEKIQYAETTLQEVNNDLLHQWKQETLMILDNLIESSSKYYQSFEKLHYKSGVYSFQDPEGNRERDEEAYKRDLQSAISTLKAIVFGVEKGLF